MKACRENFGNTRRMIFVLLILTAITFAGARPLDIEKPSVVDRTMEVGPLKRGPVPPSAPSPCTQTTIVA